jgi:hypothetical protein
VPSTKALEGLESGAGNFIFYIYIDTVFCFKIAPAATQRREK